MPMDPQDRLPRLLAGVGCTACGASLAEERIVVLAQREELAFVEFRCGACGSTSLGLVVADAEDPVHASADLARYGEFGADEEIRLGGAPPIDTDDVLRMHAFLSAYDGDLRGLFETPGSGPGAA